VAVQGLKAFVPAHRQFRQSVATIAEAVRAAIDNYVRNEQHNTQAFQPSH
jgi:hypothetical protein